MGSGRKILWLAGFDPGFGFSQGDRGLVLFGTQGAALESELFPPILSRHGRDAPPGPVRKTYWGYLFTHSIGRRTFIFLGLDSGRIKNKRPEPKIPARPLILVECLLIRIPQSEIRNLLPPHGGNKTPSGQFGESRTDPLRFTIMAWTPGIFSIRANPFFGPSTKTVVARASASMAEGARMVTL